MEDSGNRLLYMALGMNYPILLFILFYVTSMAGEGVPLSAGAFVQPFFGDNAALAILFLIISALDMAWYLRSVVPMAMEDPSSRMLAASIPQVIAVFGFILGFLELNPWGAMPFFLLSFLFFSYGYMRVMGEKNV